MWMDKEILLIEMFLALFPAGILGLYLDIFFSKSPRKIRLYLSYMLFFIWQFRSVYKELHADCETGC